MSDRPGSNTSRIPPRDELACPLGGRARSVLWFRSHLALALDPLCAALADCSRVRAASSRRRSFCPRRACGAGTCRAGPLKCGASSGRAAFTGRRGLLRGGAGSPLAGCRDLFRRGASLRAGPRSSALACDASASPARGAGLWDAAALPRKSAAVVLADGGSCSTSLFRFRGLTRPVRILQVLGFAFWLYGVVRLVSTRHINAHARRVPSARRR